jgi:uncharacterized protein (TIGR03032 family)
MQNGAPKYVTAVSRCDVVDGWRERRHEGGILIDVENDRVVTEDLSMPHSPRVNGGVLWVLDSGRGDLARVDPKTGKREQVAFCPGFARGLSFWRGYALVRTALRRLYHRHPQRRHRAMDPLRGCGARIVRRGVHPRRESADVRRPRQSRDAHLDHLRREASGSTAAVVA